jgi:hypothetical protein
MKATRKVKVPASAEYEYDEEYWACPGCDQEFYSESEMMEHYGRTHAAKNEMVVAGHTFYKFENEFDFQAYAAAFEDMRPGQWAGPGWYEMVCEEEPCRKGCCSDWITRGVSAREVVGKLLKDVWIMQGRITKAEAEAAAITEALGLDKS